MASYLAYNYLHVFPERLETSDGMSYMVYPGSPVRPRSPAPRASGSGRHEGEHQQQHTTAIAVASINGARMMECGLCYMGVWCMLGARAMTL